MAANSVISPYSKGVSGVMEQPARDRFIKQHRFFFFFGLVLSLEDTIFVQEAAINNDLAGRPGLNYKMQFSDPVGFKITSPHTHNMIFYLC